MFRNLNQEEQILVSILQHHNKSVDELLNETGFSGSKLAHLLINMELEGLITQLPGMNYQLNA